MTEQRKPKLEAALDYQKSLESKVEEAEKEIERLKGLIEDLYNGHVNFHVDENSWQQFKTENNL
jgi:hypothetical protein